MQGKYIAGVLRGYQEKAWPSDPNKMNRRVCVETGKYTDDFGVDHVTTELIDIQYDDVEKIKKQCDQMKGKKVIMPFIPVAKKGGRDGAWLSQFMPKGGDIKPLKQD